MHGSSCYRFMNLQASWADAWVSRKKKEAKFLNFFVFLLLFFFQKMGNISFEMFNHKVKYS